jgi:hypothetical protein
MPKKRNITELRRQAALDQFLQPPAEKLSHEDVRDRGSLLGIIFQDCA